VIEKEQGSSRGGIVGLASAHLLGQKSKGNRRSPFDFAQGRLSTRHPGMKDVLALFSQDDRAFLFFSIARSSA
jgi:hypothetical protein